jgi:ribosomal protein L35AE/L33A
MVILRIEHPVPDYAGWKQAFDSDLANRRQSGVRGYQILRSLDDPNYVMIDLEFDAKAEAETLLAKMRVIWKRAQGTVMPNPQARIVETVERVEL